MGDKLHEVISYYTSLQLWITNKQINKCIESIINQTYKNLEIIVDDGSKDKSGWLCDQLKENNNRIIVTHQKNGGVSEARNIRLKVYSW